MNVLPEMSVNPWLSEGSSPILHFYVIYSSNVIFIETQEEEEMHVPTLSV